MTNQLHQVGEESPSPCLWTPGSSRRTPRGILIQLVWRNIPEQSTNSIGVGSKWKWNREGKSNKLSKKRISPSRAKRNTKCLLAFLDKKQSSLVSKEKVEANTQPVNLPPVNDEVGSCQLVNSHDGWKWRDQVKWIWWWWNKTSKLWWGGMCMIREVVSQEYNSVRMVRKDGLL